MYYIVALKMDKSKIISERQHIPGGSGHQFRTKSADDSG